MPEDMNEIRRRHHSTAGDLDYHLECFGGHLANKIGYKGVDGMDAIWLYLIKTYHWTPAYVRGMNLADIRFVLSQEMANFTNPTKKK